MTPRPPQTIDESIVGEFTLTDIAELREEAKRIREADRCKERLECEGSLIEFMIRAWEEIEPGELDVNWHHEEIADALEAITRGEMRNLVINVPPRCSKTLLTNVFYPAWVWAQPESDWG